MPAHRAVEATNSKAYRESRPAVSSRVSELTFRLGSKDLCAAPADRHRIVKTIVEQKP